MHKSSKGLVAVAIATLFFTGFPSNTATARSGGSPVCEIDRAGMTAQMGATLLTSPNGWSLSSSSNMYLPNGTVTISLANTSPTRRFRGLLLWAQSTPGTFVGSFALTPEYQNGTGCSAASFTHNTATPKSQMSFTWTAPGRGAGDVVFRAFLVEECGIGSCRNQWVELTPITVNESASSPDGGAGGGEAGGRVGGGTGGGFSLGGGLAGGGTGGGLSLGGGLAGGTGGGLSLGGGFGGGGAGGGLSLGGGLAGGGTGGGISQGGGLAGGGTAGGISLGGGLAGGGTAGGVSQGGGLAGGGTAGGVSQGGGLAGGGVALGGGNGGGLSQGGGSVGGGASGGGIARPSTDGGPDVGVSGGGCGCGTVHVDALVSLALSVLVFRRRHDAPFNKRRIKRT